MKYKMLPYLLAMSLGSGFAAASVPTFPLAPGDTITPVGQSSSNYAGTVFKSGAEDETFTDSYNIDFTQYCVSGGCTGDEFSFKVTYTNLIPFWQNLNQMSMSLYDVTNSEPMWTLPATIQDQVAGLYTVGAAYKYGFYTEGEYRLDVSGAGSGAYAITIAVPEPETWAVFLAGFGVLGLRLSKRFSRNKSV